MLYRAAELTVSPVLRAYFRPAVTGRDYVPRSGPAIIAANHISASDEVFTPIAARRQVFYFAKAEYFHGAGLRGELTSRMFYGLGQVPVDRSDPKAAAASIDVGVDLLAEGKLLGIYPEGTRSPDGRLHKFRTGVARLALRSGVPVIPVGLVGTDLVLPPGSRRWRRHPVGVHFGPALDFSGRAEEERSARVLREVSETIRSAIQGLSGQEYVNAYGSAVKATG
ncbi:1-acyl-sn-glycerol-3-phosphate acyltransferase [Jatrophihabitans telluris]|uniref:1-acyl-sn-glycerol-3-phosphate acyltransferase n=1 Tax=Jatrophihabitans telluris TaxID=2038343 RepID=A0ABY4R6P8_9ACTN|nr:lysophospholipid acyltransferase family protein [Jatrophihabitans telluris]UQX90189.1 1-acyl-sn-glycerol-3-phosphate acyltransferase [Jatrophihabitans telluris]